VYHPIKDTHASPSGAILPENQHFPRTEGQRDHGGCLVKLDTPETERCQLQVDASAEEHGTTGSDPHGAKESFAPDQAVSSTANPAGLPKGASSTCTPTTSSCDPGPARRVSTKLDTPSPAERGTRTSDTPFIAKAVTNCTPPCPKGLPFCETLPTIDSPGAPDKGAHWVHTFQGCLLSEHPSGCNEGCESGSHPPRGAHSMSPLEGVDETDTLSSSTDERDQKGRDTETPLAGGQRFDTANTPGDAITSPFSGLPVHEMDTKGYLCSRHPFSRTSSTCTKGTDKPSTLSRFTPHQRRGRVRWLISTRVTELELSLVACYRLGLNPLRSEVLL